MSEPLFLALLKRADLPQPEAEFRFVPGRKFRADYCWPPERIILEVDGGVWTGGRHTRGSGFVRDMEKLNFAASLGYRVFRVTPDKLCDLGTIAMLTEALTEEAA